MKCLFGFIQSNSLINVTVDENRTTLINLTRPRRTYILCKTLEKYILWFYFIALFFVLLIGCKVIYYFIVLGPSRLSRFAYIICALAVTYKSAIIMYVEPDYPLWDTGRKPSPSTTSRLAGVKVIMAAAVIVVLSFTINSHV